MSNSAAAATMGGLGGAMQSNMDPRLGTTAGTGMTTPTMGGATSLNGLGNSAISQAQTPTNNLEALTQAYSGIQQYAGLSGLLGQGK